MLGFLDWLVQFLEMLWTYLVNFIESLILFLSLINVALPLPVYLTGFVPSIIGASISAVVAIGVAKLLLGWGNT